MQFIISIDHLSPWNNFALKYSEKRFEEDLMFIYKNGIVRKSVNKFTLNKDLTDV